MAAGAPRIAHQPALDGLRGAAVAAVLLFHGEHLRGGYLGVDVFFVLSGFLITSLLLAEVSDTGGVALGHFWSRRARRLLPAVVAVLVAVAGYAALVARPDELIRLRGDALATLGYVANWRAIVTGTDYWALFRSRSPLEHTWSLAIEEQFYLVWPLAVLALARWRAARHGSTAGATEVARRVLVLCIAGAAASYAAMAVLYSPADPSRAYFGTDARVGSILVGAGLAAILAIRGPVRSRGARRALEIAGAAGLTAAVVLWTVLSGSSPLLYRGGFLLSATATAAIIAAGTHPDRGLVFRGLSVRPLRLLGLVSYGVYLWHWPVFVVVDTSRTGITGWPLLAVRVAITLAIAAMSYVVLEQPIRRGAVSAIAWRAAVPAVAVALVAVLLAATTGAQAPRRLVADPIRAARAVDTTSAEAIRAAGAAPVALPPPRVMLVGNSVSLFAGDEGFKAITTRPALDVLNLGSVGCRFLPEETRSRGHDGRIIAVPSVPCRTDWPRAVATFRPDVVLLLFAEPTDSTREIDGRWTEPCEPGYDTVFERELHDQVRLLASGGATVVVSTAAYIALPATTPKWFAHNDCQNDIIRRVAASEPNAVLADVFAWLCPALDKPCETRLEGVELRPDGVHFREAGARLLARWLIGRMQDAGALRGVAVDPEPAASPTAAVR